MSREEALENRAKVRKNIGAYLNEFRRAQGLNLVDVADSVSLPICQLDDFESGSGKLNLDHFSYLCRFYGILIDVHLKEMPGIDYDRRDEHREAQIFRANQPKEADDVK